MSYKGMPKNYINMERSIKQHQHKYQYFYGAAFEGRGPMIKSEIDSEVSVARSALSNSATKSFGGTLIDVSTSSFLTKEGQSLKQELINKEADLYTKCGGKKNYKNNKNKKLLWQEIFTDSVGASLSTENFLSYLFVDKNFNDAAVSSFEGNSFARSSRHAYVESGGNINTNTRGAILNDFNTDINSRTGKSEGERILGFFTQNKNIKKVIDKATKNNPKFGPSLMNSLENIYNYTSYGQGRLRVSTSSKSRLEELGNFMIEVLKDEGVKDEVIELKAQGNTVLTLYIRNQGNGVVNGQGNIQWLIDFTKDYITNLQKNSSPIITAGGKTYTFNNRQLGQYKSRCQSVLQSYNIYMQKVTSQKLFSGVLAEISLDLNTHTGNTTLTGQMSQNYRSNFSNSKSFNTGQAFTDIISDIDTSFNVKNYLYSGKTEIELVKPGTTYDLSREDKYLYRYLDKEILNYTFYEVANAELLETVGIQDKGTTKSIIEKYFQGSISNLLRITTADNALVAYNNTLSGRTNLIFYINGYFIPASDIVDNIEQQIASMSDNDFSITFDYGTNIPFRVARKKDNWSLPSDMDELRIDNLLNNKKNKIAESIKVEMKKGYIIDLVKLGII